MAGAAESMEVAHVAAGNAREALAATVLRSLILPGSVSPAEQHRLITADRRAERACAEVLASRTDRPG